MSVYKYIDIWKYIYRQTSPSHATFVKACHWPSDHMINWRPFISKPFFPYVSPPPKYSGNLGKYCGILRKYSGILCKHSCILGKYRGIYGKYIGDLGKYCDILIKYVVFCANPVIFWANTQVFKN